MKEIEDKSINGKEINRNTKHKNEKFLVLY